MKRIKMPLLARIIIAILLGVIFGNFFNEAAVRAFLTFNGIFSQFLGFMIPLIIISSHHSGNSEADLEKRRHRWHCRIHYSALCHHPSLGINDEDYLLCAHHLSHQWYAVQSPPLPQLHLRACHLHGSSSGSSGRSRHGSARSASLSFRFQC